MKKLSADGRYELTSDELAKVKESFIGYYTDEDVCRATVKDIFEKEDRLIDTHTAVAVSSATRYMNDYEAKDKMLVVSTASPYKFAGDVLLSLSGSKPEDDLLALEALNKLTGVAIPSPLASILTKEPKFTGVIEKDTMPMAVRGFALK